MGFARQEIYMLERDLDKRLKIIAAKEASLAVSEAYLREVSDIIASHQAEATNWREKYEQLMKGHSVLQANDQGEDGLDPEGSGPTQPAT